jgi:hypothetical protein
MQLAVSLATSQVHEPMPVHELPSHPNCPVYVYILYNKLSILL